MAKASTKSPEEKLRVVLSVLRGELSVAAAGRRRWGRAVVAGFVAVVLVATTTAVVGAESGSVTVRVAARKLATDRVEFAVQQQVGDAWSERQLPARRLFPADTAVGRWLVSSAINVGAVTLRVTAQRLADGRIEFAVQQRNGDTWDQRQLPTRRFFPADTAVGRWLVSSPLTLNVNGSQSSSPAGAAAASGSDCAPLPDDVPQHTRERLCLPEAGDNTFRVFYGPGNYDYKPLPIRVGSRLEFYSTRVGGGTDSSTRSSRSRAQARPDQTSKRSMPAWTFTSGGLMRTRMLPTTTGTVMCSLR